MANPIWGHELWILILLMVINFPLSRPLMTCISSRNKLFERKLNTWVLNLCARMVARNPGPDETVFISALRAFRVDNAAFQFTEQFHAKIIQHGFAANQVICNHLIGLYSKFGFIDSAEFIFQNLHSRDSVSWVAMISGLSLNGQEEEAFLLFCELHKSGIFPTPYALSSAISAGARAGLFLQGEQLHGLVFKWGLSMDTFVCNALVTLYSRQGKFINVEQVFSRMRHKDGSSYNSILSGLAQHGFSYRAIHLFEKMQAENFRPDCVTVAGLLTACASTRAVYKGKQLHSYATKAGFSSDTIIEGALLDLYVKCSEVEIAHEFFLTTDRDNVVMWNEMLVAYGQLGDLGKSFQIFSQMQVRGISPNQYTFPAILRSCIFAGALHLGEQIHSQVIKTGFHLNAHVCSVLMDMYAKHGELETAMEILRSLPEDDVVAWTVMIAGCTQCGLFDWALVLFKEMKSRGIRPDDVGFLSAISACQASSQGRQIHAQSCVLGYSDELSVGTVLVHLYARCGRIRDAFLAFEKTDHEDIASWNGLISGLVQSNYYEEALQVFARMNLAGMEPNFFTLVSTISAAANTASATQGEMIHGGILKRGYDSEIGILNVLISLLAKCGRVTDAHRLFVEMPGKTEISWNTMIMACSQHGHGREALRLFKEMKLSGAVPNHITFVGVLSACSHVGLVDEGLEHFHSMSSEHGLTPELEHYVSVVDILGRAGKLGRAREFIEKMPMKPTTVVWKTLLSACRVYKNMELGEVAAFHLLELEAGDSATYVLLSNIYAASGKWKCRDRIRQVMKERGVKKEAGRSWIEVKNTVHAFFVGDRLNPAAGEIYEVLMDLGKRAAEAGYVQESCGLWSEEEAGRKDPAARVHSEKLAICFGLLRSPRGAAVVVMKNLRICNDCHSWTKFISGVTKRTIVVRDTFRFHHFDRGVCSCNDFW